MSASVVLLNVTYVPLTRVSLERAVRLVLAGKAEVIHGHGVITSPTIVIKFPKIIRLLYNIVRGGRQHVALTKKNVLLRDKYSCGYCGAKGDRKTMTVDHVIPKSRGGPQKWENLVACCAPCNRRKGNRTPQEAAMKVRHKLREPEYIPFLVVRQHEDDEEMIKILTFYGVSIMEGIE